MNNKTYKSDKQLSLTNLAMPFLFMTLANFIVPIINTLALALVPNNGVIYSESVGVANQIYSVFTILTVFGTGGIGVIVGQKLGSKSSTEEINKTIFTCITIALLFSFGILVVSETTSPFILYGFLTKGTDQYNNAVIYIETISLCILFGAFRNSLGSIINTYGFVRTTIAINLLSIVIDVTLTFSLVLGTDIGILGSSLGTLIAFIVTTIIMVIVFNKKIVSFNPKDLKIHKEIMNKLLMINVPIGAEKLSYNLAMFTIGIIIAQLGQKFASDFIYIDGNSHVNMLNLSYTIIRTFSGIITVTSVAFSQGCSIISSRHMGAKNYDGARQIIRKSFFISIVFDVLAAIILFFLRDYVVMFFQITNPIVKDNFKLIQDIVFVPFIMLIFLQIGRTLNIIYLVGPTSYGNLIANSLFSVMNT